MKNDSNVSNLIRKVNSRGDVPTAEYDYRRNVVDRKKRSSGPERQCSLIDMYVNFDDIGWSSWIISPKGASYFYVYLNLPQTKTSRLKSFSTARSFAKQTYF